MQYLPGDHVGIFPGNQPELVQGITELLKDAPPADQTVRLETYNDGKLDLMEGLQMFYELFHDPV